MGSLKKVGVLVFVLLVFASCGVNKSTEDSKKTVLLQSFKSTIK